jgi:hypothetical protein
VASSPSASLYTTYYNRARTHLSVNKDAPSPRTIHAVGRIVQTPFLGGLHHLDVRVCFPTGTPPPDCTLQHHLHGLGDIRKPSPDLTTWPYRHGCHGCHGELANREKPVEGQKAVKQPCASMTVMAYFGYFKLHPRVRCTAPPERN